MKIPDNHMAQVLVSVAPEEVAAALDRCLTLLGVLSITNPEMTTHMLAILQEPPTSGPQSLLAKMIVAAGEDMRGHFLGDPPTVN